ncbi:heme exporter protein CcmD [Pseudomaricurvus alcaniphilus]|nr:heme exporter protein CcmD [Pseudomaricurvus alcaniphilus]NHN35708.1 heme exporter protein CcmD [Pseudomaricurvus alcaniphilus]
MAGHGPYVWAAYGITLVSLLYLVVTPLRRRRALLAALRRQQRMNRAETELSKQGAAADPAATPSPSRDPRVN